MGWDERSLHQGYCQSLTFTRSEVSAAFKDTTSTDPLYYFSLKGTTIMTWGWDGWNHEKMQLDVEVNPPANDVQMGNLQIHKVIKIRFGSVRPWLFSSNLPGQTRRTDRRKATHKSPSCLRTGGLKNKNLFSCRLWATIQNLKALDQWWDGARVIIILWPQLLK